MAHPACSDLPASVQRRRLGLSFVIAGVVFRLLPGLTFTGSSTVTVHHLVWVLAVMIAAITVS